MTFTTALIKTIIESLGNNYSDNYDFYRFGGRQEAQKREIFWKYLIKKKLKERSFVQFSSSDIITRVNNYDPYINSFEYLYNLLRDMQSKELLIKILAYRILGYKKVKLPTNNEYFWKQMTYIEKMGDRKDVLDSGFNNWRLYRYRLGSMGIPIEIYYTALGIYVGFILKQYEYRMNHVEIGAREGDVVIDAGGCWGDTALYFANSVGKRGKVFTFEFIPSNLGIMKRNISLNPSLESIIDIVVRPVWSESDKMLFYADDGPGSRVTFDNTGDSSHRISTIAIDDWVEENGIEKVDFIKMDIEGSELDALIGAEQTIRRYRPKLAIAIYHRVEDFKEIPRYIHSLNLGYRFYLGHFTIHAEETVLFATT
jgi:FkbM family methyltransferase